MLIPSGRSFQDFVLRTDYPVTFLDEHAESQQAPMITVLGVELGHGCASSESRVTCS